MKILIVEDEPSLREIMVRTLTREQYVVEQAATREIVQKQLNDPEHDVFSGLPFLDREDEALTNSRKEDAARDYIANATDEELADVYIE